MVNDSSPRDNSRVAGTVMVVPSCDVLAVILVF